MRTSVKISLFLGAMTIVACTGLASAQLEGPMPPDGPMQGLMRGHSRLADRLLESFDKNHTGKVTHDAMNRAIYAQFVAVTHGAQTMTQDQFIAMHMAEFRQHASEMFKRIDWHGTGKLTLEDYAAPQRVRFMMMDKDGSGSVSCASSNNSKPAQDYGDNDNADRQDRPRGKGRSSGRGSSGRSNSGRGGFGLGAFCAENDQNRDGKVTRAELDSAINAHFAAATHGAKVMTFDQYMAEEEQRFRDANVRTFDRLDQNGDGKLTLAEFASSELRLFQRLDKNQDGVLTQDEMRPQFNGKESRSGGGNRRARGQSKST